MSVSKPDQAPPSVRRSSYRILQITALPFPPEIRVLKEARTLAEAGYQSAVLCPPIEGRPSRERWEGIEVFRPRSLTGTLFSGDKLLYQAAYFSPSWYRGIREAITAFNPHVVHVHDIWLGRTAFTASRGRKLVMDLHENMPAAVAEYLDGYRGAFRAFNAVFKTQARVRRYERALLTRSDLVLAVVKEARERVLETHPFLRPERVVNVENLESRAFIAGLTSEAVNASDTGDIFSVLYIGGFGPHRGIDTLIRAMHVLKSRRLRARAVLIGARGGPYLDMLRALVTELDVSSHVEIAGWVSSSEVLARIRRASVGAVPHKSNPHTDSTIPHKLFQYMIAERPVLVSTSPPLARTVRAAGAGEVFAAGNPEDCANAIERLASDPTACAAYGKAGRGYVLQQGHNWEDESGPRLLAGYDTLLGVTSVPTRFSELESHGVMSGSDS